jgi:cysteine desulfuration protein SufE
MATTTDELIDTFDLLGEDWEERYGYIIGLARKMPVMPEAEKTEETRVHGCQSRVWLTGRVQPQPGGPPHIEYHADSDGIITKGLAAVLLLVYSGKTPQEIQAFDVEGLFEKLGLTRHLTPARSNGLFSMVQRIRQIAAAAEKSPGGR